MSESMVADECATSMMDLHYNRTVEAIHRIRGVTDELENFCDKMSGAAPPAGSDEVKVVNCAFENDGSPLIARNAAVQDSLDASLFLLESTLSRFRELGVG